jgi:hypothetical protein
LVPLQSPSIWGGGQSANIKAPQGEAHDQRIWRQTPDEVATRSRGSFITLDAGTLKAF